MHIVCLSTKTRCFITRSYRNRKVQCIIYKLLKHSSWRERKQSACPVCAWVTKDCTFATILAIENAASSCIVETMALLYGNLIVDEMTSATTDIESRLECIKQRYSMRWVHKSAGEIFHHSSSKNLVVQVSSLSVCNISVSPEWIQKQHEKQTGTASWLLFSSTNLSQMHTTSSWKQLSRSANFRERSLKCYPSSVSAQSATKVLPK